MVVVAAVIFVVVAVVVVKAVVPLKHKYKKSPIVAAAASLVSLCFGAEKESREVSAGFAPRSVVSVCCRPASPPDLHVVFQPPLRMSNNREPGKQNCVQMLLTQPVHQ